MQEITETAQHIELNIDEGVINPAYRDYVLNPDSRRPFMILFGGSSSSKTYSTAQRIILDLLTVERNYLVVKNNYATIKDSFFNDLVKVIEDFGVDELFEIRYSPLKITSVTGYSCGFRGGTDPERLKGYSPKKGILTDVVVEEASETHYELVQQIKKRMRGIFSGMKTITLLFNPITKANFCYVRFMTNLPFLDGVRDWDNNDTELLTDELWIRKFTYKDNKFLSPEDIQNLENETDPYYYQVYTLGNFGVMGGLIFPNHRVEKIPDWIAPNIFGLDFGFSNDPTSLVGSHITKDEKTLYICKEYIYKRNLLLPNMAKLIRFFLGNTPVIADSADPRAIATLNKHKCKIIGAKKGSGSILAGINYMKGIEEIIIDPSCKNAISEFGGYQWAKDSHGNSLLKPKATADHCIDAVKYSLSYHIPDADRQKQATVKVDRQKYRAKIKKQNKFGAARF